MTSNLSLKLGLGPNTGKDEKTETRLVRVARHAPTLADSDTGSVGVSVGGVTATSFSTPVTR